MGPDGVNIGHRRDPEYQDPNGPNGLSEAGQRAEVRTKLMHLANGLFIFDEDPNTASLAKKYVGRLAVTYPDMKQVILSELQGNAFAGHVSLVEKLASELKEDPKHGE